MHASCTSTTGIGGECGISFKGNLSLPVSVYIAMTRHRSDRQSRDRTSPRPRGRFESLYPTIYPSASEEPLPPDIHPIGFRPDTFVTPIIDRVRRGERSFRQPNHGRVSHRFHSVTNSAAATGVISESVGPSIRRPGNGNGSDFRLSGSVEVHTQYLAWPAMQ